MGDTKTVDSERDITLPAGMMALLDQTRRQHEEIARLLGDRWRGVGRIVCAWDGTPLHSAAQAGNSDAVLMLLAAGADMNIKDNKGKTPLELVSVRDKAGMEQSLHVLPQDDKRLVRIVQDAWMPAFPREEGYLNTGEAFTMFFGKSGKWQVTDKK